MHPISLLPTDQHQFACALPLHDVIMGLHSSCFSGMRVLDTPFAEALTLGHRAGLSSNGTSGPDLPQCIAKDCWEVIGVCGLVPARSQALLLHAFQESIRR